MRFAARAAIALIGAALMGNAPAPDWSRAQAITVHLSNFKFAPASLTLQHGTPYRLRLVNTASGGHDFAAEQFFASSEIAPEDRPRVDKGRVELDGGATVDILLVPLKAGTYHLHCTHFMHSMFGMKGTIIVN